MNTLSSLPKTTVRSAKRVGRGIGSGKGSKSTRGTTRHQKARGRIPLAFEGGQGRQVKKYPLIRGRGKNKSIQAATYALAVSKLNNFAAGTEITLKVLHDSKLVDNSYSRVKIVANGTLEKNVKVSLPVSAAAKKMIEGAGGSVLSHERHTA